MRDIFDVLAGEVTVATPSACLSYFTGALRDGTFSRGHGTWRLSQKSKAWLVLVRLVLRRFDADGWIYREGRDRSVWVLETCYKPPSSRPLSLGNMAEDAAFIRGYFDAEGGIPRQPSARFYVQLAQKSKEDLEDLRERMRGLGLTCGRVHVPSVAVDPDYWRFYVASASHYDFYRRVGSWHPRKRSLLDTRFNPGLTRDSELARTFDEK
jgi:LAGLIDADG-like domain